MTTQPPEVAVTQADREAAASTVYPWKKQDFLNGEADASATVQAFARHRLAERERLVNTPETADFVTGVPLEATHQRERWGVDHDAGKTPEDWFWLIGYLAQKALRAQNAGDLTKAQHHTISTAAALANWHAALTGADTSMRPGVDPAAIRENAHVE